MHNFICNNLILKMNINISRDIIGFNLTDFRVCWHKMSSINCKHDIYLQYVLYLLNITKNFKSFIKIKVILKV